MGMAAEILAIGLFQPEIVDCLDDPANTYQNTKPGTRIVVHIIEVVLGSLFFALCSLKVLVPKYQAPNTRYQAPGTKPLALSPFNGVNDVK